MHVHRVIYWERIASVWLWQNCTFPQFRTKPPLRPERARPIQVHYCPVASLLGACAEAEQQATDRPAVEPKTIGSLTDNWFWVHMRLWKTCQWLCSPDSLQSVWKKPCDSWVPGGRHCRGTFSCSFQIVSVIRPFLPFAVLVGLAQLYFSGCFSSYLIPSVCFRKPSVTMKQPVNLIFRGSGAQVPCADYDFSQLWSPWNSNSACIK